MGKVLTDQGIAELYGTIVGRWEIQKDHYREKCGRIMYYCKCSCGTEKYVYRGHLMGGKTLSCGCYHKDVISKENKVTDERLHRIWGNMKSRCNNPNVPCYKYYGAKGVRICKEWESNYSIFKEWALQNGYQEDLEIDRVDRDRNYEPDNCRWVDRSMNVYNSKRNVGSTGIRGVKFSIRDNLYCETLTYRNEVVLRLYTKSLEEAIAARKEAELKYFGFNVEQ